MNTQELFFLLQAAYPKIKMSIDDGKDYEFQFCGGEEIPEKVIILTIDEVAIINPTVSDCSRFEIDPLETYGIALEHANLIAVHNKQ